MGSAAFCCQQVDRGWRAVGSAEKKDGEERDGIGNFALGFVRTIVPHRVKFWTGTKVGIEKYAARI
jgi:hypothetical protein